MIGVEEGRLRNKMETKEEIEGCLDNIMTDRGVWREKGGKGRRMSLAELHSESARPQEQQQQTFREHQYLLKGSSSQYLLPQIETVSQMGTVVHSDNVSRQSRLVSLTETERRLPITHSLSKKNMQELIMSRIAQKTLKP